MNGALELDERGLARRGLLVRHLVMPGMIEETRAILRFVAEEIDRPITRNEHAEAVGLFSRRRTRGH